MNKSKEQNQTRAIVDDLDLSSFDQDEINMPIHHNFEYDDFQKRSMYRLYQNKCVFVSAPTSSGKTVVASYAIGLSLMHQKRAIYTSPIKSLSNQKFQEFKEDFADVGILTGDTNINRKAKVLIMTTEILRSMLYKNDPFLKSVETVIFDEFHYLAHEQRGGVWEESVIRMPNNINMAFLSASMPNAKEIASWISKTKNRDVYIEMHNERPVPLNHCIYINNQFFTISNHQKNGPLFDTYQLKRAKFNKAPKRKELNHPYFLNGLILNLQSNKLLPALMFEFSINNIETKTNSLLQCIGINLVNNRERNEIDKFINEKVLNRIDENDKKLLQVQKMIKLLKIGIGIHHSGILPILKETVEILLNKGYIKLVFCTSTIGMGLNLPVRTCCFTNIQKFNGTEFVDLTMTEYQQMSGRAGRRGKDDVGTSVICIAGKFPDDYYLKDLFCGEPEEIKSQFQISFKMVINSFCDQSGMKIHEVMRKSFYENSSNSKLSEINKIIEKNKDNLRKMNRIKECPQYDENKTENDIEDVNFNYPIYSFADNFEKIDKINKMIVTNYPNDFEKALKIGIIVLYMERNLVMTAIIDKIIYSDLDTIDTIILLNSKGEPFQVTENFYQYMHLLALPISENMDTINQKDKQMILNQYNLKEKLNKLEDFMKIDDDDFIKLANLHHQYIVEIINSPCLTCFSFRDHFKTSLTTNSLRNQINQYEKLLMNEERKEYGKYLKMLKDMNYITEENGKYLSTKKGTIANDIYGHEIISTELINRGILNDCSPEEIVAICSCFVAQRVGLKNEFRETISVNMNVKVYKILEMVKQIVSKMNENRIPIEDDFLKLNMNPNVMYPVYMWAKGKSFCNIMKHSGNVYEGQMASVITKVYSMLTNFAELASSIDDKQLEAKIQESIRKIQRGVVFAKSLYLYLD